MATGMQTLSKLYELNYVKVIMSLILKIIITYIFSLLFGYVYMVVSSLNVLLLLLFCSGQSISL